MVEVAASRGTSGSASWPRAIGARIEPIYIVLVVVFVVGWVAVLRAGAPWVGPDGGYDLESIAAVVLGGTALAGGRGSVLGTLAGVLIFAIIDNVFNEFQVDPFLKTLLRGVIIVGAVASYSFRSRETRTLA